MFSAALVLGLVAGNSAYTVLRRALLASAACWFAGWLVGRIAEHIVDQNVKAYKAGHPIVDEAAEAAAPVDEAPAGSESAPASSESGKPLSAAS